MIKRMTEKEKMLAGEVYSAVDPELIEKPSGWPVRASFHAYSPRGFSYLLEHIIISNH